MLKFTLFLISLIFLDCIVAAPVNKAGKYTPKSIPFILDICLDWNIQKSKKKVEQLRDSKSHSGLEIWFKIDIESK